MNTENQFEEVLVVAAFYNGNLVKIIPIFLKDCLKDRREESGQIEILETTRDNRSFILRTRRRPTSHTPRDPKLKDAYTVVATTNRQNALKLLTLTRDEKSLNRNAVASTAPKWITERPNIKATIVKNAMEDITRPSARKKEPGLTGSTIGESANHQGVRQLSSCSGKSQRNQMLGFI